MCFDFSFFFFSGRHRRLIETEAINSKSMSEINRKRLKELLKIAENNICADCSDPQPNYASITIGVFLCASCVQIHRKLGILRKLSLSKHRSSN